MVGVVLGWLCDCHPGTWCEVFEDYNGSGGIVGVAEFEESRGKGVL